MLEGGRSCELAISTKLAGYMCEGWRIAGGCEQFRVSAVSTKLAKCRKVLRHVSWSQNPKKQHSHSFFFLSTTLPRQDSLPNGLVCP